MVVKLKDINGVFWVDRDEAVSHLTNGFVELFGEENRDFFESIQNEMIDEGIKAGRISFKQKTLSKLRYISVGIRCAKTEDEKEQIKSWFLKFFSEKEYNLVISDKIKDDNSDSSYQFYENADKYEKMFVKRFSIVVCDGGCEIDEEDEVELEGRCYCNPVPPKLYKKSPPSFKYFKSLKHRFMSINMFGEGGMSLDRWNASELNYMLEEGEWVYYPESIHRVYYYLGAQIGRCQIKEEFFNEIIEKVGPGIPYQISSSLKSSLDSLSTDYDERILVPLIREKIKDKCSIEEIEDWVTHKEISQKIKNHE